MVSVGWREQTKNGEAFLVKHATPGPGRTKEGGSYEKWGRVAVRGEGPCDRNTTKLWPEHSHSQASPEKDTVGVNSLTFSFSHPSSPTSQPIANQCGSQRARGPGGTICRGQCAGGKGRVERVDSMFRRAEGDTHYPWLPGFLFSFLLLIFDKNLLCTLACAT